MIRRDLSRSIPILFLNLMKAAFVKLEIAFQPCLAVVTWASLKIPEVCKDIRNTIKEVQAFSKEVKDMKEARVDEVFDSIAHTKLINLVDHAQSPSRFSSENQTFGHSIATELEIKSAAAEKAVITIINKFLTLIRDPDVETVKYDWLDPEKVNRHMGSQTKLTKGSFEPGFDVIDRTNKVNITRVHNDCMELFAYFNCKLVETLVKCTKNSFDLLKKRVGSSSALLRDNIEDGEIPLMLTHFVLQIPNIIIVPSIDELQNHFTKVITNLLEVHKGVVMWGQRYSPISRRKNSLGVELDDNDNTGLRNYHQTIVDHKEVIRSSMSLQGAILMLKGDIAILGNVIGK